MRAVDSSITVAAFAAWHEHHELARAVVADKPMLPAHTALETYSVMTRLPPPHRVAGGAVRGFLEGNFRAPWPGLDADAYPALVAELDGLAIVGGSVYEALIAATARAFGAILVTADGRASPIYEAMGVDVELVAPSASPANP